ncbi:hypothetical protein SAMD00019534_065710 [Acytostelium subglobosum LB1]|uniref:hypothetical protein n=1 Tax=Acytostelium subglobosum LB1 TaxID=1410327 RepID=UPI000644F3FB|nr:hypothetical protein SAMD00019534_065710 [Acytostelium subglobosum LB1]GAM23396.1 hypothetical protein SAMD00019534_065710 [Acytostelium subglobosum LB1]|eukprot:XP_012753845.1 hypothetical protein SAMD00019534_065710 [Acytostelium subglobosum LB1]
MSRRSNENNHNNNDRVPTDKKKFKPRRLKGKANPFYWLTQLGLPEPNTNTPLPSSTPTPTTTTSTSTSTLTTGNHSITFVVDSMVQPTSFGPRPFTHASLIKDPEIEIKKPKVLRSSIESDSNLFDLGNNSFVQSAFYAYSHHLHLVIRPDDVWLALITQFSIYVNANSDQLRSKLVPFDDKRELIVLIEGISTEPIDRLAAQFSDRIAENIKDPSIREWVMPAFTTTTNNDRVVGAFALMSSMKNYFNYTVRTQCGLPKVTMLGTVDDWKQVRQRAERLIEFDLKDKLMSRWLDILLPVLDNLVMSAEGKPDTDWWNRIANKVGRGSGVSNLSGWITTFIPFTNKGKWNADKKYYQDRGGWRICVESCNIKLISMQDI